MPDATGKKSFQSSIHIKLFLPCILWYVRSAALENKAKSQEYIGLYISGQLRECYHSVISRCLGNPHLGHEKEIKWSVKPQWDHNFSCSQDCGRAWGKWGDLWRELQHTLHYYHIITMFYPSIIVFGQQVYPSALKMKKKTCKNWLIILLPRRLLR